MALQRITDTVLSPADHEPFDGTLVLIYSANAFQPSITDDDVALGGMRQTLRIRDGAIDVQLEANDTIQPEGTYYEATYSAARTAYTWREYWRVTTSGSPLTLADIRISEVVTPSAVIRLGQLLRGGASDGDVLTWSGSDGAYEPVAPGDAAKEAIGIGTVTTVLKGDGDGGAEAATPGEDFAPPMPASGLLKADGAGGAQSAVAGTDYAPALPSSGVLKGNGGGGAAAAVEGTDYIGSATFPRVATYEEALALAVGSTPKLIQVATSSQFNNFAVLYIYDGLGGLWQTAAVRVHQNG